MRTTNAVHPRVCGERHAILLKHFLQAGSSPRVRGTPRSACVRSLSVRFIPACAGNANAASRWIDEAPVHPRVCGERLRHKAMIQCARGSSPRVRGTHMPGHGERQLLRFIPACAGNAFYDNSDAAKSAVHPRVCGERTAKVRFGNDGAGSSPRVRGTLAWVGQWEAGLRFIPACAGNAASRAASAVSGFGSSPRVRGTLDTLEKMRGIMRFIPACAGNAIPRDSAQSHPAVHPRVCGERLRDTYGFRHADGSSPRVRGTPSRLDQRQNRVRFIPACAGNACRSHTGLTPSPVHPRVCGERALPKNLARDDLGSSPRVRGTHFFHLFDLPTKNPALKFYRIFAGHLAGVCLLVKEHFSRPVRGS